MPLTTVRIPRSVSNSQMRRLVACVLVVLALLALAQIRLANADPPRPMQGELDAFVAKPI